MTAPLNRLGATLIALALCWLGPKRMPYPACADCIELAAA